MNTEQKCCKKCKYEDRPCIFSHCPCHYTEQKRWREIPLTKGQVALVDEDDYEMLSKSKWQATWDRHSNSFFATRWSKNKTISRVMSRVIMKPKENQDVDHINHDTLDNRKTNLRLCSHSENTRNRRKRSDNSSGVIGASWKKDCNKWQVAIKKNQKTYYIGLFSTLAEASAARKAAVDRLHGEFGYHETALIKDNI